MTQQDADDFRKIVREELERMREMVAWPKVRTAPPIPACSYCGVAFPDGREHIKTADVAGIVVLCRPCYEKAGNAVR